MVKTASPRPSPYVTRALWGVGTEGLLGAALTGLMVLLFLRDRRSVLVVVLNIPLALPGAVIALWLSGQTLNLMTLGGLALAVGTPTGPGAAGGPPDRPKGRVDFR
jgi:multidrug efflux pump subunit AcrB